MEKLPLLSKLIDNIKDDRTAEDLLFQTLLDWGVDLALPITKETIAGLEVFFVDGNALAACFEKEGKITEAFCKELAKRQPLRVVFRDSGFKDDSIKINVEQIFQLIDSVYSDAILPQIEDGRAAKTNPLNANFDKKEFKELWNRINRKAIYSVHFDSSELIDKCVQTLNKELHVTPLQYTIQRGEQADHIDYEQMKHGDGFKVCETSTELNADSIHSAVKYDMIGKVAGHVRLTRRTVAEILSRMEKGVFGQFKTNPESFIAEAARLICEQKATVIIERLSYDAITETHDIDIFTDGQSKQDFSKAGERLKRHIYDYVVTDSKTERTFVKELDASAEVAVYAKLPKGFSIPTPVGNYNPDWAISFKEGSVKHVYFVAETKGSMSTMELRKIEDTRIECARRFFAKITSEQVKYDVVDSYGKLMELVK